MPFDVVVDYKVIERKHQDFEGYLIAHNFIVRHIRDNKVGFFGRRKLKRALKHLWNRIESSYD